MNAGVPSPEQQARFLALVAEGFDPVEAAAQAGDFTASRFRGLAWRDHDFDRRYRDARKARYKIKRQRELEDIARRKVEEKALRENLARASARVLAEEVVLEVRARLETDDVVQDDPGDELYPQANRPRRDPEQEAEYERQRQWELELDRRARQEAE